MKNKQTIMPVMWYVKLFEVMAVYYAYSTSVDITRSWSVMSHFSREIKLREKYIRIQELYSTSSLWKINKHIPTKYLYTWIGFFDERAGGDEAKPSASWQ